MKASIAFATSELTLISVKSFLPTDDKACSGQGWNQSMTVQEARAGNLLARVLKPGPTGEKHKQQCKFSLTFEMKNFQTEGGSVEYPAFLALDAKLLQMASFSSLE
jgi:hypothetical protein